MPYSGVRLIGFGTGGDFLGVVSPEQHPLEVSIVRAEADSAGSYGQSLGSCSGCLFLLVGGEERRERLLLLWVGHSQLVLLASSQL
jgi:hypothetical protein